MILYINNEHCSSVEQLKEYFTGDLTSDSDIYADLLDYGRYGDIAEWLREMGESEMASRVDSISGDLSDFAFFAQLKAAILDTEIKADESLKPSFDKCFSFEGVKCDIKENEAKVSILLKVLMCVKEDYELSVSSDWGTRGEMITPYNYSEGKITTIDFALRKRHGKEIGDVIVKGEGKELSCKKIQMEGDNKEFSVGDVKFKMIRVEGGTYTKKHLHMKEPGEWYNTFTTVSISDFMCGETPVTQALWKAVMGTNPSQHKGDEFPVETITWHDFQSFIAKLNQITGKHFRMLTESEWEFAARGGNKTNGTRYAGSNDLEEVAWYRDNSNGTTHIVKSKKPNELGIFDMNGNVCEWCQDWYREYNEVDSETNPQGPISGNKRVNRGGCFGHSTIGLDWRYSDKPTTKFSTIGGRLALVL